jgi:hypothetical protein
MPYPLDLDDPGLGEYLVDDPVITHANPMRVLGPRQLLRAMRKGVLSQRLDISQNALHLAGRQLPKVLPGRSALLNAKGGHRASTRL